MPTLHKKFNRETKNWYMLMQNKEFNFILANISLTNIHTFGTARYNIL